ncbi:uncharacterized protein LY89DRAFT_735895 [Mollisia scopiformis]|uniref:Uncharacterized protein n=1 Tax=Mollisia scopiformis TaxID=149040 RepID=A0A194X3R3_MOLSC|nr:uncharacterized protein LY89DRAFT_735895 [Mollisia scopiformis]KUJ14830.1 hypothetical protein LY89DRAFT_735895 [Mollisia scopiformis]
MSDLASIMLSRGFLKALYTGNMLWHTSAFIHFSFRPQHTLLRVGRRINSSNPAISSTPGGDAWHHDILDYLGKINLGFVALAALRLTVLLKTRSSSPEVVGNGLGEDLDVLALTVLGIANASQAWNNLVVLRKTDRWILGKGFDRITVLDTVFAVLDFGVVVAKILKR